MTTIRQKRLAQPTERFLFTHEFITMFIVIGYFCAYNNLTEYQPTTVEAQVQPDNNLCSVQGGAV